MAQRAWWFAAIVLSACTATPEPDPGRAFGPDEPELDTQDPPPPPPGPRPALARVQVHVERDLAPLGCDPWTENGQDVPCRWAAFQLCRSLGFGGAVGVPDLPLVRFDDIWREPATAATVVCLGDAGIVYREYAYDGLCTASRPGAAHCEHLARVRCQAEGHAGTTGVIGFNAAGIATQCVRAASRLSYAERTEPIAQIAAADTRAYWAACDFGVALDGNRCAHHTDLRCVAAGGEVAGTDVLELSVDGQATFACLGTTDTLRVPDLVRANSLGFFDGSIRLGDNVMGGPAYWGEHDREPMRLGGQVWADGLVNDFDVPVLIRSMTSRHNHAGPSYSRDECLGIGVALPSQDPVTGDGETECTYSQQATDPGFDLGDRGIALYPGERITFVGVAQWLTPTPHGLHASATLRVTGLEPGVVPVRRLRFPRDDDAYRLTAGVPVTVPAGCVTPGCAPLPDHGANTNWFVQLRSDTKLAGVSWFISSPLAAGDKLARTCIELRADAGGSPGALLRPPICHELTGAVLGPAFFRDALGSTNSFVVLDVPVPARAWVGVELTMRVAAQAPDGTYMDLGAYLWFDDTNRDIGRPPP